ncbi:MAG TPA: hypothetical protein VIL74_08775 [Pyrinomonadaceae bacterium]|jgi:hypothetical protein
MALISQKQAKLILRREAGYSVALAAETVSALPKTKDGAREKIRSADVDRLVEESRLPSPAVKPATGVKIRPFRREIRAQIGKL